MLGLLPMSLSKPEPTSRSPDKGPLTAPDGHSEDIIPSPVDRERPPAPSLPFSTDSR